MIMFVVWWKYAVCISVPMSTTNYRILLTKALVFQNTPLLPFWEVDEEFEIQCTLYVYTECLLQITECS